MSVSVHVLADLKFGSGTTGYQYTSPRTGEASKGANGDDATAKLMVPEERRRLSGRDRVLYKDAFPVHMTRATKMKGHITLVSLCFRQLPDPRI